MGLSLFCRQKSYNAESKAKIQPRNGRSWLACFTQLTGKLKLSVWSGVEGGKAQLFSIPICCRAVLWTTTQNSSTRHTNWPPEVTGHLLSSTPDLWHCHTNRIKLVFLNKTVRHTPWSPYWPSVLVSSGIEVIFFLAAGAVLCFGFSTGIIKLTQQCLGCCWVMLTQVQEFSVSHALPVHKKLRESMAKASDPNWPKGYSTPHSIVLHVLPEGCWLWSAWEQAGHWTGMSKCFFLGFISLFTSNCCCSSSSPLLLLLLLL